MSHLAPPSAIISGHHCSPGRMVVFKHNLSLPDSFMFCRAYRNCRLCAHRSSFAGQTNKGLPPGGPYLWKGPPTVHTIRPLYSQFRLKAPLPPPNSAERLLYALLFVCFHVFWKQQPFTPLLCDAGWYNDAGPQTGNNLELWKKKSPSVCVSVCVCVCVCLCVCVSVCVSKCLEFFVWLITEKVKVN